MRRGSVFLALSVWLLVSGVQAQSSVPNGVFVRESNGTTWLVLDGQRVSIPIWSATDSDIGAIPQSGRWATMNDAGAIVAGDRPAWLESRPMSGGPAVHGNISLAATNVIHFRNSINGVQVNGFIENTGSAPAGSLDLAISLLNGSGSTVGAGGGETGLHVIPPGGRVPFAASIGSAPDFKEVRVQVQGKPPGAFDRYATSWKIEGMQAASATRAAWPKITGQVVNTGNETATLVRLTVAVYDKNGELLEVRDGFAKLDEIAPGQSSPFEIEFIGGRGLKDLPSYEVWVEGRTK